VVGLPDAAVKESVERVRSAMQNSGYEFPRYKTVINLAPADMRKEGRSSTCRSRLGILLAKPAKWNPTARIVRGGRRTGAGRSDPADQGALSAALLAKKNGFRGVILPSENAPRPAW